MAKYRKKPVVIEAVQYTGDNKLEISKFTDGIAVTNIHFTDIIIPTLEGDHTAGISDWIIKGVAGEFYPCKNDIFKMTYDVVGE